jgi:hypothetical protein
MTSTLTTGTTSPTSARVGAPSFFLKFALFNKLQFSSKIIIQNQYLQVIALYLCSDGIHLTVRRA